MSTRPPEPEFLIQWREWIKQGPPKCCHTCDHFDTSGHCMIFDTVPPSEFINEVDSCSEWELEIPF